MERRYRATELEGGDWAVQVGRARKGRVKILPDTRSGDPSEVEREADRLEAVHLIRTAAEMLEGQDIDGAMDIGHEAQHIVWQVDNRAHEHPDYCPSDPCGWKA